MADKDAASKAAMRAAMAAQKKKAPGKDYWRSLRLLTYGAGVAALIAVLYGYYLKTSWAMSSKVKARAEQNFLAGNVYFEGGDLSSAVQYYRSAVAINPFHADAWTNLGNTLSSAMNYSPEQKDGLYAQAAQAYKSAVDANVRQVDAHFNLGVLHHTFERVELAIPAYERAVRLDPLHHDALSNLGSARHKVGNYDGAIRAYEEAIKIVAKLPADVVDFQMLSMLYYLLGSAISSKPDSSCRPRICSEEAAIKVREALRVNMENTEAREALEGIITDENVTATAQQYAKGLFEDYMWHLERIELNGYDYKVPELLRDAIVKAMGRKKLNQPFRRGYDIGCGYGDTGRLMSDVVIQQVGADKNQTMVEKARETGIYIEVVAADLTKNMMVSNSKLADFFSNLEIVTAGDFLVHFADLTPTLKAASAVLGGKGFLAFTVETLDESEVPKEPLVAKKDDTDEDKAAIKYQVLQADIDKGYKERPSTRYAHTRAYIKKTLEKLGWDIVVHDDVTSRYEGPQRWGGANVTAQVVVAHKPGAVDKL